MMIGVVAPETAKPAVREFFELFKTPWEFCRPEATYEVLISSCPGLAQNNAKLRIIFATEEHQFDRENQVETGARLPSTMLVYREDTIPILNPCLTFPGSHDPVLLSETGAIVGVRIRSAEGVALRIGFDLFAEVETLLSRGQSAEHAQTPTLELQIALLRDLIISHDASIYEVPPVPAGYRFIVCLTHDVDHFGIRHHGLDHTVIGFLARALVGTFVDLVKGRKSVRQCVSNWKAAFSLPFVYCGLATDFWETFGAYRRLEKSYPSTFFVIPKKDKAGRPLDRPNAWRAARYDIDALEDELLTLIDDGCEVALHGIDAWSNTADGREERRVIQALTGRTEVGVRMHWLYFDQGSWAILDEAGFSYDSTSGYNEVVGYRAGTTQAFRPLSCERLLELPMHVMDTALFYKSHLNLSSNEAMATIDQMITGVGHLGGVLTINWHDRSIAPERLWDRPYVDLLEKLSQEGAWFATASQAVAWFRKRRAFSFAGEEGIPPVDSDQPADGLPGIQIRLHRGRNDGRARMAA